MKQRFLNQKLGKRASRSSELHRARLQAARTTPQRSGSAAPRKTR